MADPASYRPAPGSIPDQPGVYKFRDEHGRVVYVGKAKSLRARLSSYFQDTANLHPRTQTMVRTACAVEWTVVTTEVEALQLEYNWIKEFDPRFNVRYRDDKSYPSLAVTLYEEYPRLQVMRGPKRRGVRYFGPYAHAWAIRETLDALLRVFPARTCSAGVFKRQRQLGRPCLLGYIDKCSAPCVERVTAEQHRAIVDDFVAFMSGQTHRFLRDLERQMQQAAADLDFERAARLRDDIKALERATEKQAVVLPGGADADVIAFAEDPLEAAVHVFFVRDGRVRGQRGWVIDKVDDVETADLVETFVLQMYGADDVTGNGIPREVLVPVLPPEPEATAELLSELRGTRVDIRVPQRGDKRALLDTVERNAKGAFQLHKLRRASDLSARSQALQQIQDALELPEAPLRIECYDVSNLQGTEVVASMVVFEDGVARKSEYRRFAVRGLDGQDDVASIHQVIRRRFARYLAERARTGELGPDEPEEVDEPDEVSEADEAAVLPGEGDEVPTAIPAGTPGDAGAARAEVRRPAGVQPGRDDSPAQPIDPATGRPRKFAYPPNLVVVDGGPPQVAAAARALAELGIDDVSLCGLAKRLEEVWLPGQSDPVILPRASEGLYLLQRIRDEAHRFAITYHRQRRSKSMTASALDAVPGLGDTRRKALLAHFGSLKRLRAAGVDEIAAVPGIGPRTAAAVASALSGARSETAVDTATGEILDG